MTVANDEFWNAVRCGRLNWCKAYKRRAVAALSSVWPLSLSSSRREHRKSCRLSCRVELDLAVELSRLLDKDSGNGIKLFVSVISLSYPYPYPCPYPYS